MMAECLLLALLNLAESRALERDMCTNSTGILEI